MVTKFNSKKFKITLSIFFFILIFLTLYISFNYVFNNNFPLKIKENNLEKLSNQNNIINLLFLGDSHTDSAINPYLFDNNSFNFGNGGESYIEIYYHMKYYNENKNFNISNYVIEVDYSMLLKKADNRFKERIYYYNDRISFKEIKEMFPKENIVKLYIEYKLGFLSRGEFFGLIFKDWRIDLDGGKEQSNIIMNTTNYRFGEITTIEPDNSSAYYFNKILEYSKQNNISLIFIKYPISIQDYNSYNISSIENHNNLIFTSIENKYKKDYIFLDYEKVFFNNSNYFTDGVHLNKNGAVKFNSYLKDDLYNNNNNN